VRGDSWWVEDSAIMGGMKTPRGRTYVLLGDPAVVTLDRLEVLSGRLDSDPRIASVSVVAHREPETEFMRAVAPAGSAVLVAQDIHGLTAGMGSDATPEEVSAWARLASERGLWHDWWLTPARDIARAPVFLEPHRLDSDESGDLASSRYGSLVSDRIDPQAISMTVDATWLGPHQTGAQVLTTSALQALAKDPRLSSIDLIGIAELPEYARHLGEIDKIRIREIGERSDVLWYPNQIDQRVNIRGAREQAKRVITTYLDLIAYDIPLYHTSTDAWASYRGMQRRIALSVDGITTISTDVANRLIEEVPRLNRGRVRAIPLGLDHIKRVSPEPGDDIEDLRKRIGARPFLLVLGNDFQHKNRDFAIRVWEEVLTQGVNCDLVLAGLHVKSSSSRKLETTLLEEHTNLRGQAYAVEHVCSDSREWLLANAAAVVYPSSAEGFGFVPYEAAALGTPATFTAFGPLVEISGVKDVPSTWEVGAYARDLIAVLQDATVAQSRVESLRSAIQKYTWQRFAEEFVTFTRHIAELPPVEGALVGGTATDANALAEILSSRTWRATESIRSFGRRLKGHSGGH